MSGLYMKGEEKDRPGIYRRYDKESSSTVAAAMNGVFCIPVQAKFGPIGEVKKVTSKSELEAIYMKAGTVDAAEKLFEAGANTVYIYRLGTGGVKGTLAIKNTESASVVTLETAYETDLPFAITLKQKLGDTTTKECSIYNGTTLLEKISFLAGDDNEVDNFIEAMKDSDYLVATKTEGAAGTLETLAQSSLTGGSAVTVTNEDYGNAFTAFEPYRWNVLVLDTVDSNVQAIAKSFMDRIYEEGSLGICVLGETSSSLKTRISNAKSYNKPYIVYCGSGYVDTAGNRIDGYLSVAVQAGIIGCMNSTESTVHAELPDAESCIERLTNTQYSEAIRSGLLLISEGPDGQIWIDSGVNTYTVLDEKHDKGWKKIKRVSVRYEASDRIDRTIAPLIGKIGCEDVGIGNVIQQAKKVLSEMQKENKILEPFDFYESTEENRKSDSAYFIISFTDIDTLEKVYLNYRFQETV